MKPVVISNTTDTVFADEVDKALSKAKESGFEAATINYSTCNGLGGRPFHSALITFREAVVNVYMPDNGPPQPLFMSGLEAGPIAAFNNADTLEPNAEPMPTPKPKKQKQKAEPKKEEGAV